MAKANIQNNNSQNIVLIVIAVLLLVIGTAAASVYISRSSTPEQPKVAVVTQQPARHVVHREVVTERRVATNCDDGNIVGKGIGGIAGGAGASTIGKGNGKTAATIAGTLGGAYLGGQYINTNGVTCR